ncbi:MAG: mevalonate kinase [Armatimonadota bacterium]
MRGQERVCASAPGRLCLFGEHQDFLGLSVIACPIDLRIQFTGTPRDDLVFAIEMPDIGEHDVLEADGELEYVGRRDYLRAAMNVLRRAGLRFVRGYDLTVTSRIPINAGTSSSSAMVIAWVRFLLETQAGALPRDPVSIAEFGNAAEVQEFGEPGGMMDHYTSALGGLLHIDCAEPITVTRLPAELDGFVLGNSLEKKPTTEILAKSKSDVRTGLAILRRCLTDFDLRTTPVEVAAPFFADMPPDSARKLAANFVNRDLCRRAEAMLSRRDFDPEQLGRLLTAHHVQLRDGLGISTDKIERLIEASMEAGALGAKINGSGGGGCMFAYAPGRQDAVKEGLDEAGAEAFVVSVDEGVSFTAQA